MNSVASKFLTTPATGVPKPLGSNESMGVRADRPTSRAFQKSGPAPTALMQPMPVTATLRAGLKGLAVDVLLEDHHRVQPREARCVFQDSLDLDVPALVWDVIEIAVSGRSPVVDGRRDIAVLHRQDTGGELDGAGGAERMAQHRLHRADPDRGGRIAERPVTSSCLVAVVLARRA